MPLAHSAAALLALALLAGRPAVGRAQPAAARPAAAHATAPASPMADGAHDAVVHGVRLWYRVAGAPGGTPVLFLHGGPGYNSHSFATLAGPALERGLRMIYLDQRGSGRSERPWTRQYALDTLVADLEALRAHLGVPQLALVGHSFGGTLALEYAARHPERVARMVLVAPASDIAAACAARVARLETAHPAALARARADTAGRGGTPRDACDLAFNTLSGAEHARFNDAVMFPDSLVARRMADVDSASGLRNTGELSQALFGGGLLGYRFAGHARVTMPVLVVTGGHDAAIGMPAQEALARTLPAVRLSVYERAGHFVYLDEPARFTREVTAFLAARR